MTESEAPSLGREPRPLISVVIIGRNEGANLERCLKSCLAADWPDKEMLYCDSESTDNSVEIARSYGAHVIVHKNRRGNPSIGRNIGWRAAKGDYVYLLDGDMVLERDFLAKAFPVLISDPKIACVVGIREEMHPENLFVSLIDSSYHNYTRFGEVPSPRGGGGLFRREALVATGGYFEDTRSSEEPLLGQSLRRLGYKTILIESRMAYHDVRVYSPAQYLRFRARQARIFANTLLLGNRTDEHAYRRAWKQIGEFGLLLVWIAAVLGARRYRATIVGTTAVGMLALLGYAYPRYRSYKRPFMAFAEIFLIGKPLHIVLQAYYVARGLLWPDARPNLEPDGQILKEYTPLAEEIG